jgi:hypothetical protein
MENKELYQKIKEVLNRPDAAEILTKSIWKLLGLASCWDSLDDSDMMRIIDEVVKSKNQS